MRTEIFAIGDVLQDIWDSELNGWITKQGKRRPARSRLSDSKLMMVYGL